MSNQSPEEIQAEIEQQREQLAGTLDALSAKLDVKSQAKVKVVEFGSMTCGACAAFATEDEPKLVEQYVKTGNVSFEFRNFVRDPLDIAMALITRCAGATPQFFTLTNGMYAEQKSFFDKIGAAPQDQLQALQSLPPAQQFQRMAQYAGVQEWAAQRGMPSGKSTQCLANQSEIERLVQMNADTSSSFPEFTGTPGFVINGSFVGSTQWPDLEQKIKAAL